MTWICAACGHPHPKNDPPCRKCAHELFARVDEKKIPDKIDSSVNLEWHCKQCGAAHQRNSPPCKRCGSMGFEAVYYQTESDRSIQSSDSEPGSESTKQITGFTVLSYLYGLPVAFYGLAAMTSSFLAGACIFLAGAIALPTFRTRVRKQWDVDFSLGAILLLTVAFWTLGLMIYGMR